VIQDKSKPRSIGFVSGLAVGTVLAAVAAFLYRTKKGQKIRLLLADHYRDALDYFDSLVKDMKKEAKKLEKNLQHSTQTIEKKTKTTAAAARRVFKRLGKPLLK
jgi:gas vesicle protein